MLKFSDLSVDMRSIENSLNSYMNLYPNSYLPLLILYLSRMDLMEVVENIDPSNSRVIVSITPKEINDFFKESIWESKSYNEVLEEAKKNSDFQIREIIRSIAHFYLLEARDKNNVRNFGLTLKESANSTLLRIKNILLPQDNEISKSGRVSFFYLIFSIGFWARKYSKDVTEDDVKFENWISFFDDTLRKIQEYSSDKTWMQPSELTDIVLARYKNNGRIFNPFAGLASYTTRLQYYDDWARTPIAIRDNYYGQEIDVFTWAIGKLRLLAYDTDSSNYILADSTQWTDLKFENIYCTPPFGMKITNEHGKKEYADSYVIRRGIASLENEGELVCVVPASFLTRKDTFNLRTSLVDQHLINTIVMLPEGVFSFTNIKTAIVVISKKDNLSVKFVDASKLYYTKGREKKLSWLIKDLISYDEFPDHKYLSYDERKMQSFKNEFVASLSYRNIEYIRHSNYSLNALSYISISANKEAYETLFLGNVFFPVSKNKKDIIKKTVIDNHLDKGRYVAPENLSQHPYMPFIDYGSLSSTYYNESMEAIQGPAILFALKNDLRPSLIQKDQVVFIPKGEIIAFGYDLDDYSGEYIINELSKKYVKDNMVEMDIHKTRTAEDIEIISIMSPKPNEYGWGRDRVVLQKEVLDEEKSLRIIELEKQLAKEKDDRYDDYLKALRQRKHRIQQVMNELCPAFSLLDKCRLKTGVLYDDDIVGKRTGKTVSDYFHLIGKTIDKVENMITNIVDEDEWGDSEFVKLKDFLSDLTERNLSDRFVFKVNYLIDDVSPDIMMIAVNRDKMATAFENIIANAENWGFINAQRNDYCIRIDVSKLSSNVVRIRVANNGEAIDPSLNRDHFFEWGVGNHTGYGTWQIKNIIEHYQGTVELKEYPDDLAGFQTEYEIVLPFYV
ncbi:MAG: N-6 DNA methylase [Prevotella sp.]|nr:N-6 DNA methylase [Prevotella sp.]